MLLLGIFALFFFSVSAQEAEQLFDIKGTVVIRKDMTTPKNWKANTRVLVNYGEYIGFLK